MIGFAVMLLMMLGFKIVIYYAVHFEVYSKLDSLAILVAIFMGLIVPIAANIIPIKEAISYSLRDSLDIYRHKIG